MERWGKRWSVSEWRSFLAEAEAPAALDRLRPFTHTGRPLGSPEFVIQLEGSTSRPLAARKRGRPKTATPDLVRSALPQLPDEKKMGHFRLSPMSSEQVKGDKALAGRMLGISRATLYRKLKRYSIGVSAAEPSSQTLQ
jgi:DNA-binding NtrC family response regulator